VPLAIRSYNFETAASVIDKEMGGLAVRILTLSREYECSLFFPI
jgi:hypothetical protein